MSRRYNDDDDDFDANRLASMRQVYSSLVRQGASEDELASAYEPEGKVFDPYSHEAYDEFDPLIL